MIGKYILKENKETKNGEQLESIFKMKRNHLDS